MEKILFETQYFPPIQFFTKWLNGAEIVIEGHENYQKRSYRNRMVIMGPYGYYPLSIPLKKGKNEKQPITKTLISYNENWELKHWKAIMSCYGNSPYFEHYEHLIEPLFLKGHRYLFDLNMEILETLKPILGFDNKISISENYQKSEEVTGEDFRNKIRPVERLSEYDENFLPKEYNQVFAYKHGFLENLSILDLIFNCGPEARLVLRDSFSKS